MITDLRTPLQYAESRAVACRPCASSAGFHQSLLPEAHSASGDESCGIYGGGETCAIGPSPRRCWRLLILLDRCHATFTYTPGAYGCNSKTTRPSLLCRIQPYHQWLPFSNSVRSQIKVSVMLGLYKLHVEGVQHVCHGHARFHMSQPATDSRQLSHLEPLLAPYQLPMPPLSPI